MVRSQSTKNWLIVCTACLEAGTEHSFDGHLISTADERHDHYLTEHPGVPPRQQLVWKGKGEPPEPPDEILG